MFRTCPSHITAGFRTELISSVAFSSNKTVNDTTVKPFNSIPGPTRLPIWGNLYLYKFGRFKVSKYHRVLEDLHSRYGPLVRQDLGTTNTVIHVFHPDDIKTVYGHEDAVPHVMPLQETTQIYRKQSEMSPGLGNVNGAEWLRLRSAVRQMMLQPKEVSGYANQVCAVARDAVQRIQEAQADKGFVPHLHMHIAKFALESSGVVCFGRRLGCLDGGQVETQSEKMVQANQTIFQLSGHLKFALPIYRYVSTPKWKRLVQAEDFFYAMANKWVAETIAQSKAQSEGQTPGENHDRFHFMTYLLSKKELTEKDVTIITFSLFADGLSTTVPAVLYNLFCLAANPAVQETARAEVIKANELNAEAVAKMPFLKAVVKETFRMYPIGTEVSRITQRPMVLSGFDIPAGTHLNLSPNVYFRSTEFFARPNEFLPARWLRDGEGEAVHPFLLTPFGFGSRTCAGRRFAEQDMYLLLAHILRSFRIELVAPAANDPLEQEYKTLLFPAQPIKIRLVSPK